MQKLDWKNNKVLNFIREIAVLVIIVILIKSFLIEFSKVPTSSMENTILVGDFLLVNKFKYGSSSPRNIPFTNIRLPYFQFPAFYEPDRGEIVVFEYPGDRDQLEADIVASYVKRCMGLPGDTLEVIDKVVFVNGKEMPIPPYIQYRKPYTNPENVANPYIFPKGAKWNEDNYGPIVIPKKGDVIKLSSDNIEKWRTIIDREYDERVVEVRGNTITIDGKPATEYTIKKDYYFMMGDNRDDSADSRFWGFVPRDLILGEAFFIYWSWDTRIPFSQPFDLLASIRFDRIAKLVD